MPNSSTSSHDAVNQSRTASVRNFLMCAPDHFAARTRGEPAPTNPALAVRQWENLRDTYRALGHTVTLLDPIAGLADMVFAARGGFTLDGLAYGACFASPQRQPIALAFRDWFNNHGFDTRVPGWANEGEDDFAVIGGLVIAGTGFPGRREGHAELATIFGREVLSLTLVRPRFPRLDLALTVLDSNAQSGSCRIAYLPAAFDRASQAVLAGRFPDAILVEEQEAALFALNCVSDGRHVVVSQSVPRYISQLLANGYTPVPVDLSELLRGGGGIKCCTQELRR